MTAATRHRERLSRPTEKNPEEQGDVEQPVAPIRRIAAEVVGTFFLVFAAAGVDIVGELHPGELPTPVHAVAPALVVAAMIYAIGAISGAHLNPAVTIGFALRTVFPWRWVPAYVAAELAGAIAAAATLHLTLDPIGHEGTTYPRGTAAQSLGMEILLTTLLVTVAMSVAARHRLLGPDSAIAMGATIAAAGLIGIAVSGASMNPARSLGPAIVAGVGADQWIYVTGPIIGACIAAAVVWLCQGPPREEEVEAAEGDGSR